MIELQLGQVYQRIEKSLAEEDFDLCRQMLWGALDQFPEDPQLLFYGGCLLMKEERWALAKVVLERCVSLFPNARNYANLGAVYRRMNHIDEARNCLRRSIAYEPGNPNCWNNLAATYTNEGDPTPGVAAAKKALEVDPKFIKAKWNLGLLQLELGNFGEGFDCYRDGLVSGERLMRNYTTAHSDPLYLEELDTLTRFTEAHGRRPRVIVWGEQGIGDELMMSTMLPDLHVHADIVYDCHPRLEKLMRDSYPFVAEFHPTRKEAALMWPNDVAACDFKLSVADLGRFFRRTRDAFPRKPTLVADQALAAEYRDGLDAIAPGGKRFVGVAWSGGVLRTMRWYRSIQPHSLWPLLRDPNVVPVSLQYEDDALTAEAFYKATGKYMLRFPGIATHHDYHHTAALVMALDEVITVCQSVAHLSAALGQKTTVLVPAKPAWRYGLEGSDWYWYGANARLYRQTVNGEWTGPLMKLFVDRGATPLPPHEASILGEVHAGESMLELGCKQVDAYKRYFEALGIKHTSVDLNGAGGALKLDLTDRLDLGEHDIVTNFGTSEHVFDQPPCWDNMHRALKVGGRLVSTTPLPGDWAEHGRWYPDEMWYRIFCRENDYVIDELLVAGKAPRRMVCLRATKQTDAALRWPDYPMFFNETGKKVGAYV